ncbi:lysE type translocator family protein [Collimonas arenae]|uniref:LysE type translocator family protein n=1 Tax=Collimonas arenae TaxID=279058 RepID=A0A127QMN4_9BURK|nr:LysE family translocator [Collimonas arenae]AMP01347.1 lysE type translocator family protein [Collimonas arenae]AMP11246.1 lysE type translocator family protein [Collimonas arenae]
MEKILFLKALLIGLSIAAPVGPVGLLCIQRTLMHGPRIGFVSGLGAASADAVYGAVGAFGLAAVTHFFVALATPLALCGAFFLSWMGIRMLFARPAGEAAVAVDTMRPHRAFASVFALTLTNPMTILSFVAVFASISGNAAVGGGDAGIMVLGIGCGSALWWLTLALGISVVRHKIDQGTMRRINQLAGLFLIGFALWQLFGLWR